MNSDYNQPKTSSKDLKQTSNQNISDSNPSTSHSYNKSGKASNKQNQNQNNKKKFELLSLEEESPEECK